MSVEDRMLSRRWKVAVDPPVHGLPGHPVAFGHLGDRKTSASTSFTASCRCSITLTSTSTIPTSSREPRGHESRPGGGVNEWRSSEPVAGQRAPRSSSLCRPRERAGLVIMPFTVAEMRLQILNGV